jgi:hypothetical protein
MFKKYYDREFMKFMKLSLTGDFVSWKIKKDRHPNGPSFFLNGASFFSMSENEIDYSAIYYGDHTLINHVDKIKKYDFKLLERVMIKHYINRCLALNERTRIKAMNSIKDDIICALTVDKV